MTTIAEDTILMREAHEPDRAEFTRSASAGLDGEAAFEVEFVLDIAAFAGFQDAWSDLAERALDANINMVPEMARAAIRHLEDGGQGCAALVWQQAEGEQSPRKLLAFFPMQNSKGRWGIPVRAAVIWEHLYSFDGTPLVDRQMAQPAIAAFVTWLRTDNQAPRFLRFTKLIKGRVHDLFCQTMAEQGMGMRHYDEHVRAKLETNMPGDEYLRESLGNKRSKEYRRLRNRLSDMGEVDFRICRTAPDIKDATHRFLDLEMAGWKGERDTAMACRDDWKSFFEETISGLAEAGQCRFDEMTLDGQVIATTLIVTSQDTGWMWKIAYDETLAKYSPGVLLVLDVTRHLIEDESIVSTDSCAMPDHPMIDRIWRERLGVTDLLITTRGGLVPGRLIEWLEQSRREARSRLKILYNKLKKESHHG